MSCGTENLQGAIADAIAALKAGGPVVFPTDTVYGLGVAVRYAGSPQVLYDIKQRDAGKPVAWLVGGAEALDEYGRDVPPDVRALAASHWPGALTLIVKASPSVPAAFIAPSGTIGLRMPASAEALELIRAVGPIATSSANLSGGSSPRLFEEVDEALLERAAASVRGAQPGSGVASTVIDCTKNQMTITRQGGVMLSSSRPVITVPVDFASHDGKSRIAAKIWTSAEFGDGKQPGAAKPRGIIQIVHGMAEHIDRYDDLAAYWVERGFVVCAENHIGHGGSVSDPSQLGHMPAHGGKDILIGDVHTLRRIVSELFEGVPYVVYGHSMGSFITRAYIARHGEGLAACVLSGTGNLPAGLSKAGRALSRAIAAMKGETHKSALVDGMGAGGYGKQIEGARTELDWLSNDDSVVDEYIADDLCGFMFSVGGYSTLLDLTAEVVVPKNVEGVPKDLPVLFVAGDGDPVGEMGKGVQAAAELFRSVGIKEVDCKLYEGMRHEIHNEIGKEGVYEDITTWIESHV